MFSGVTCQTACDLSYSAIAAAQWLTTRPNQKPRSVTTLTKASFVLHGTAHELFTGSTSLCLPFKDEIDASLSGNRVNRKRPTVLRSLSWPSAADVAAWSLSHSSCSLMEMSLAVANSSSNCLIFLRSSFALSDIRLTVKCSSSQSFCSCSFRLSALRN